MFLLTSPLVVYGIGSGMFNVRFSRIFLILALIAITTERMVKNLFIRFTPFEIMICLYWLVAFMSVLYVSDLAAFITRFFGLMECMIIFYIIRIFTCDEKYWLKSAQVYLLSSITVILASCYQAMHMFSGNLTETILPFPSLLLQDRYEELANWAYSGGMYDNATRLTSTFVESNILAGYCSSLAPFATVMSLICIQRGFVQMRSALYISILIMLALVVIAAVSKSGFITMTISILLTVSLVFKRIGRKQKTIVIAMLVIIMTCSTIYGFQISDLIVQRLSLGDSGHVEYRLSVWDEYINGSWLIGEGFGQYEKVSAHSVVLTALYEFGLFGGILAIAFTSQPLYYAKYISKLALRTARYPGDRERLLLLSASFVSFVSVCLGLHLYDYWLHPFTWISIALFISQVSNIKKWFDKR